MMNLLMLYKVYFGIASMFTLWPLKSGGRKTLGIPKEGTKTQFRKQTFIFSMVFSWLSKLNFD